MMKRMCLLALVGMGVVLLGEEISLLSKESVSQVRLHRLSGPGSKVFFRRLPQGQTGVTLSFEKKRQERSFVAVSLPFPSSFEGFRSICADAFLKGDSGLVCRLVLVLEDRKGRGWRRVGEVLAPGENQDMQCVLSPEKMLPMVYAHQGTGRLDWMTVSSLGIGLAVDGIGTGTVTFSGVMLRDASYHATEPRLLQLDKEPWRKTAGETVRDMTLGTVTEHGEKLLRMAFRLPVRQEAYVIPGRALREVDVKAYSGVRITYRSQLPAPLREMWLLIRGPQGHYGGGLPQSNGVWQTVELPFASLRGVTWEPEVRGKSLGGEEISGLAVGCHGTALEDKMAEIVIRKIELIP